MLSLLTGGAGNNNYWHWLFDVLPRIELSNLSKKSEDIIRMQRNPITNEKTTTISPDDLLKYIGSCGHQPKIIDLE